jgi:hypothetical protein
MGGNISIDNAFEVAKQTGELKITDCALTKIPKKVFNQDFIGSLKILDLQDNQLVKIPGKIHS